MGHPPDCGCIKCKRDRATVISKSGSLDTDDDGDDDTRERAAGGRLVKDPDPRKKDPADAEPLPTGGLSDGQVAALNDAFDRAADASAPDDAELARIERDIRRRQGESPVDLTERDIEEARMSTREQLLDALEGLAGGGGGKSGGSWPTLRKADADGDGGPQSAREQDLIHAVADFLDVSEGTVREHFNAVRDGDDTDTADELAAHLADHLDIPRADAAALLDELRDADDDGTGDDTARSKATVRKSVGRTRIGSDADGRAALVTDAGVTVPLDAWAGTGR